MSKFLSSLGIAQSELRIFEASASPQSTAEDIVGLLAGTGEFVQGLWRLPTGEWVDFEMVGWETDGRASGAGSGGELWRLPEVDTDLPPADTDGNWKPSVLSRLPMECLSRVSSELSLRDLAAACAATSEFRRLALCDLCWIDRIRGHFGPGHLRGFHGRVAGDACCANPFARVFCQALFGLYRARPEGDQQELPLHHHRRLVPESALTGALFPRPLLSPVFLGRALVMEFQLPRVHPGRYDVLLRVKKLLCDPFDPESVATAAGASGVQIPLLQARRVIAMINRRNVSISSFECTVDVTAPPADPREQDAVRLLLSTETVSHLLQNCSMPSDRWFYWRLASLDLHPDDSARDLKFRVSVVRRGVADATVSQEEFERELRNALLIDHLFLRLQFNDAPMLL